MDNTAQMEANLENIQRGAVAFKAIGTVSYVLGGLLIAVAVLRTLPALDAGLGAAASALLENLGGLLNYLILGWLAHRASDAFDAVSALIREMREIV